MAASTGRTCPDFLMTSPKNWYFFATFATMYSSTASRNVFCKKSLVAVNSDQFMFYKFRSPRIRDVTSVVQYRLKQSINVCIIILSGTKFKCNFEKAKTKYYRAANAILAKLGNNKK